MAQRIIATLEQIKAAQPISERLPVPENRPAILFVKTKEIDWIEADGNYVRLH